MERTTNRVRTRNQINRLNIPHAVTVSAVDLDFRKLGLITVVKYLKQEATSLESLEEEGRTKREGRAGVDPPTGSSG